MKTTKQTALTALIGLALIPVQVMAHYDGSPHAHGSETGMAAELMHYFIGLGALVAITAGTVGLIAWTLRRKKATAPSSNA